MEQIYCSVNEIVEDLGEIGLSEARILSKIVAASQWLEQSLGVVLPIIDTRSFPMVEQGQAMSYYMPGYYGQNVNPWGGSPDKMLLVSPLLSVTSVISAGAALSVGTDFILWPDNAHWIRGPYSALQIGNTKAWSTKAQDNVVSGKYGLYDEAVSLDISTSQAVGENYLTVVNGSLVSPGMVLKIEDEWELVTSTGADTSSNSMLNLALDDRTEEISVDDDLNFNLGELIKADFELMRVLDIANNTLLVSRGVNGSKRASHADRTTVNVFRTFNVIRGANGSTAVDHDGKVIYRQVPPADVNYLCRQMAALMIKKSQTGYTGRSGNEATGSDFFISEFPKNAIENVKKNYFWGGV
jgi:hypothetical protein